MAEALKSRYGWLTVLPQRRTVSGRLQARCRCRCGRIAWVRATHLRSGASTTCGCRRGHREQHALTHTEKSTYRIWAMMRRRCHNKRDAAYRHYGARGITVCLRWRRSFKAFLQDMGRRPRGLTIERINNNRGYSPKNCRWVSQKDQCRNTRRSVLITYRGETHCRSAWAEHFGIPWTTIRDRMKRGWSVHKALTTKTAQ